MGATYHKILFYNVTNNKEVGGYIQVIEYKVGYKVGLFKLHLFIEDPNIFKIITKQVPVESLNNLFRKEKPNK